MLKPSSKIKQITIKFNKISDNLSKNGSLLNILFILSLDHNHYTALVLCLSINFDTNCNWYYNKNNKSKHLIEKKRDFYMVEVKTDMTNNTVTAPKGQKLTHGDLEVALKAVNDDLKIVEQSKTRWTINKGDEEIAFYDDRNNHYRFSPNINFVEGLSSHDLTKIYRLVIDYLDQFTHFRKGLFKLDGYMVVNNFVLQRNDANALAESNKLLQSLER